MKAVLQRLPLPISGLMLGLAALGNLLGNYHSALRYGLGSISGVIFLALVLKVLVYPRCIKEGFSNPVIACIMATFPMGMMLLSTYIQPVLPALAYGAWLLGISLNILLVIVFTKTYVIPFSIKKVFSSYFVLYVGIVVGSVTAPVYGMQSLGQILFWFGLAVYLPLIPLVTYRVVKVGGIPEAAAPVIIIYAAPASLLLAGYLNSFSEPATAMVVSLGSLGAFMTLFALVQMPRLLTLPFYPSYAAFTFPFVISAIAFSGMTSYLQAQGMNLPILDPIRIFQTVWATVMVLYVLLRFAGFMAPALMKTQGPQAGPQKS